MDIGIIGCGNIAPAYLRFLTQAPGLRVGGLADRDRDRAAHLGAAHGIPARTISELLADPGIGLIVNLTTPASHVEVCLAALAAGKHVYAEKPLALDRAGAQQVLAAAAAHGRRVGCAPDTVLGSGVQTARLLLDHGAIGSPVAATAFMMCGGHERWHPAPAFYYQPGGGPLFDMGPYYLHALITLLGPVRRVAGMARATWRERRIDSQPLAGTTIPVDVPTHVSALLEFATGTQVTLVMSFDVRGGHAHAPIELYGSHGSLILPDPNYFGGAVRLRRAGQDAATTTHPSHGWSGACRGLGVLDLVRAIAADRPHRANGELALHAVDVCHTVHEAAASGRTLTLTTTCERPAAMPNEAGGADALP